MSMLFRNRILIVYTLEVCIKLHTNIYLFPIVEYLGSFKIFIILNNSYKLLSNFTATTILLLFLKDTFL